MKAVRIIAIGGGGCTNGTDPALEDFILEVVGKTRPRIGFIGTASGNAPTKISGFETRFAGLGEIAAPLPLEADAAMAATWVAPLDLVYVGGGNTARLLDVWRKTGIGAALMAAARRGTVFAGVSAGAVCWFEAAFSDALGDGFSALPGLGILRGSCCPHYSEEPHRIPAYRKAVAEGKIVPGLAIDDGVAVLCHAEGPVGYVTARPGRAAYSVNPNGDSAQETRLSHLSSIR